MYFDDCQDPEQLGTLIKEILDSCFENNKLTPELHEKLFPLDGVVYDQPTSTPLYLITLVNKARQRILEFRSENPNLPPMPKKTTNEHKVPHKTLQEIQEWCIGAAGKYTTSMTSVIAGISVGVLAVVGFEMCVHWLPWAWMKNHGNSLPLQIGISVELFFSALCLFVRQLRKKWLMVLLAIGAVLLGQLGRSGNGVTPP